MADWQRVIDRLADAESYLADVERYRDECGRERFLSDRGEQYRIEFPLQQAIQSCIDLAAHLVASTAGPRPDRLSDLFAAMAQRGMLSAQWAERLAEMARFRNLLVHDYAEVDPVRVWSMLTTDLDDIREFLKAVAGQVPDDSGTEGGRG